MSGTLGLNTQRTAFTDMSIFFGADKFTDIAGFAALTNPLPGFLQRTVPAGDASTFVASLPLTFRTGMLATPAISQEQFGTAGPPPVPGPSSVAGTSGPLAMPGGFPPYTSSQLPTVVGGQSGSSAKGIQINSMDVIYKVLTVAAAAAQCALYATKFVNNKAQLLRH